MIDYILFVPLALWLCAGVWLCAIALITHCRRRAEELRRPASPPIPHAVRRQILAGLLRRLEKGRL